MISELYSDAILEAAALAPPVRRLENPQATARRVSRICGSEIDVDLNLSEAGIVTDFGMAVRACALGQASASIVARNVIGAEASSLRLLRDQMRAMLKEDGPPPEGDRWADLGALQPIREFPQRHASTLLIFDAICDCLDQIGEQ